MWGRKEGVIVDNNIDLINIIELSALIESSVNLGENVGEGQSRSELTFL